MNLEEMFELIDKNELVLPDFQRNFVWNKNGQRALAASVLLNLPIGSFLILDGNKDDFATKKLGYSTKDAEPEDKCKFLLDGQQRLTSLRSIFGNFFSNDSWKDVSREIYSSLRTKWYIRIVPHVDEEDIFGWRDLIFNENSLKNVEPSQLENIIEDKAVLISRTDSWWNPDYVFEDEEGNRIDSKGGRKYLLELSKYMAEENILPLSIYDKNDRQLLSYTLDRIATNRAKVLAIELQENLERVETLLDRADISTIYDKISEDNLQDILRDLKGNWKVNVTKFLEGILENTEAQIISLKANEIGRAVIIFERINKGGTNLDNFDLVVARAARDRAHESLTKRIIKKLDKELDIPESLIAHLYCEEDEVPKMINIAQMDTVKNNEINTIIKKQYLNLLSIIVNVEYGKVDNIKIDLMKKERILNISYENINNLTPLVLKGITRACAFLQVRCGLVKISDLHYNLMLLPIAYLLLDDNVWVSTKNLDKIEYWYWGSIFAGEYRIYPNQRCIDDIQDLYRMVIEKKQIQRYSELETNILNIKDFSDRELLTRESLKDIPPAIHKGLLQYELSRQPIDLLYERITLNSWDIAAEREFRVNGKKIKYDVQDHHIIPLCTSKSIGESTKAIRVDKEHILNSTLNRTYILSETNNVFSANEPSKYLKELEESKNLHMLNTHFMPDNYKDYLSSSMINDEMHIKKFYNNRFDKIKTILLDELNSLKK